MIAGDPVREFRDFIASCGLTPPDRIEPGQFTRFSANGKASNTSASAKLFPDMEGGIVWNWATGETFNWQAQREQPRNEAEQRAYREKCERAKREAATERERELMETAKRAERHWKDTTPADDSHAYHVAKGVRCHGARVYHGPLSLRGMECDGALVIPRRMADGALVSLQFIAPNGEKRYLNGPVPDGAYYSIGKPDGVLCIAEGYATAASIHESTGHAVAVAFDAGNLQAVAMQILAKFPNARLVLCADDDWQTMRNGEPYNPGIECATKAARKVDGFLAVPEFGADRPGDATDFNDMARLRGAEGVCRSIASAQRPQQSPQEPEEVAEAQPAPGNRSDAVGDGGWGDPEPIGRTDEPEPYPVEDWLGLAGRAVREAIDVAQCPPALAAHSALCAMSAACMGLANVKRTETLVGPIALYLLILCESGERKSHVDGLFMRGVRDWEGETRETRAEALRRFRTDHDVWNAKREGLLAKIKRVSEKGPAAQ